MIKTCATVAILGLLLTLAGCVEREMTITSDPPGALVTISDVEVGRTPLTQSFTWYGDYRIKLTSDGMAPLNTNAKISPPIYEWPVIDFFSQIAPWTYHDRRFFHFKMEKAVEPTKEELLKRAAELKEENLKDPRNQ